MYCVILDCSYTLGCSQYLALREFLFQVANVLSTVTQCVHVRCLRLRVITVYVYAMCVFEVCVCACVMAEWLLIHLAVSGWRLEAALRVADWLWLSAVRVVAVGCMHLPASVGR